MKIDKQLYSYLFLAALLILLATIGATLYLWLAGRPVPTALEAATVSMLAGTAGLLLRPAKPGTEEPQPGTTAPTPAPQTDDDEEEALPLV